MWNNLNKLASGSYAPKVSHAINKIKNKLVSEMKQIELNRHNLMEKYADKSDDGSIVLVPGPQGEEAQITAENREKFEADMRPVLDQEVNIEVNRINVMAFDKISPAALEHLDFMLDTEMLEL